MKLKMEIIFFFENKLINIFLTYTGAQNLETCFDFDEVFGKLREQNYNNFITLLLQ